jgi:hypothetical protein
MQQLGCSGASFGSMGLIDGNFGDASVALAGTALAELAVNYRIGSRAIRY